MDYDNRLINKVFRLNNYQTQLEITYKITNKESITINPKIGVSFNPGNTDILFSGKNSLVQEFFENGSHVILQVANKNLQKQLSLTVKGEQKVTISNDEIDPMVDQGYTIEIPAIGANLETTYYITLDSHSIEIFHPTFTTTTNQISFPKFFLLPIFLAILVISTRKKKKKLT